MSNVRITEVYCMYLMSFLKVLALKLSSLMESYTRTSSQSVEVIFFDGVIHKNL